MDATRPWFERPEYQGRLARVQQALRDGGHDALLAFLPETVTWVTGFYTRGNWTFQMAVIPESGAPIVICRDVELFYLDRTCVFPDRELWSDTDAPLEVAVRAIRARLGDKAKVAVEMSGGSLSLRGFEALKAGLPDYEMTDESTLVSRMRIIKTPAEIDFQRRAGKAAEAGMQAAIDSAQPGNTEREMAAQICAAMIRAGSDLPGPGVMSSGERAYHLHGGYTDRVLERGDMVQIETTPNVHHYHARFMRPIRVAEAGDADHATVETLIRLQDAALVEVRPGVAASVPDAILRDGVLVAGLRETFTNKTFYAVGLQLGGGGEPLEAVRGSAWTFETGMTFHTYVLARGFGMSETIAITETGFERLTNFPRRLFIS